MQRSVKARGFTRRQPFDRLAVPKIRADASRRHHAKQDVFVDEFTQIVAIEKYGAPQASDSRGYGAFEDLLSAHWEHQGELVQNRDAPATTENAPAAIGSAPTKSQPSKSGMTDGRSASSVVHRTSSRGAAAPQEVPLDGLQSDSNPRAKELAAGAANAIPSNIPSNVGQELREMLRNLNVKVESITMSEGMQAMLALAREVPTARHFDTFSQKQAAEMRDEPTEGEALHPKRLSRASSPLQPGVYAGLGDREHVPGHVRGLPNRGRDMSFNQHPRTDRSRVKLRGSLERRAWLAETETTSEMSREAPVKAKLVSLRKRPQKDQSQVAKVEPDEHLAEERRQYAAWKRKVIDCARLLDLEANRFRMES